MKRRVRVIQEVSSCSDCPHFKIDNVRPDDWSQIEDWFCTNPSVPDSRGGKRTGDYVQRPISIGVEWKDKPPIPEWCPFEEVQV